MSSAVHRIGRHLSTDAHPPDLLLNNLVLVIESTNVRGTEPTLYIRSTLCM